MPSFKLQFSLGFVTSCYVIFSLSMVQAMDMFMITWHDITKPRENCNLKLPSVCKMLYISGFRKCNMCHILRVYFVGQTYLEGWNLCTYICLVLKSLKRPSISSERFLQKDMYRWVCLKKIFRKEMFRKYTIFWMARHSSSFKHSISSKTTHGLQGLNEPYYILQG